jgi:hypothetical protein
MTARCSKLLCMPNWMRSCTLITVLSLLSASVSGCTLVGAGVGAGIDSLVPGPYEEHAAAEHVRIERQQRVIVRLRNGTGVIGRYVGVHGPTADDLNSYLLIDADKDVVSVKASEVSSIAVEVSGKGWLIGGLIGLAADAVIVVATVIAVENMKIDLSFGPSGCFC